MAKDRDGLLALCLFALLFSVYLLTFSGIYHSSDEMSMLIVTDSLARRGEWDIELLRWSGEQQGSFGPDGHLYSRKGIGTTLSALPHYWLALQSARLGNVQTAMLTNGVVTAFTAVLIFLFLRRLGYGPAVSLGTALAFGLGTMAWPYARYLFSESLAGLGLMASAYFLLPPLAGQIEGGGRLLIGGTGLGLALLARLNNAFVAPFLGLLLLTYLHRRYGWDWKSWLKPLILFGLPVSAALIIIGWYNWLRFGSPLITGYLPEERFATPFLEGFYGLTFSPGKGLFWYNPLLFAALAAWPALFRRHRAEALLAGAVVLSNLAFYAPWYLWWAGHSWGPRFLVTALPFAALALAPALETAVRAAQPSSTLRHRALALGLIALAVVSVAVQLLGVAVDFNLYLEDVYADLGLYHPATLFEPGYSALVRQMAYLRPENLDLAWARGGSFDWVALLGGLAVVLISGLALWASRRRGLRVWARVGLLLLLILETAFLLPRYAPTGTMAQATGALAAMERHGEATALTELLYTEAFQNTYDGRLPIWGVPAKEDVGGQPTATWALGEGDPEPAVARFQVDNLRLDYYSSTGEVFTADRLPAPRLPEKVLLGNALELVAFRRNEAAAHPGETLPLVLCWRALAPIETAYTVFVQAIDENGVKAGQVDRPPCDGGCPTTTWRPGDLIGEWYELPIEAGTPPGSYQLIAGMYDLATGENLTWFDAQGNDLGPHLPLSTVDVQP
jgi:hypothetical protein